MHDFFDETEVRQYRPVKERKEQARKLREDFLAEGRSIHPLVSIPRTIGRKGWAQQWCKRLAELSTDDYVLERGRSLLRSEAVLDLQIHQGKASALTLDKEVYATKLSFQGLTDEVWSVLKRSVNILSHLDVLSGQLPDSIMETFLDREDGLLPGAEDILVECECMETSHWCTHAVALLYGLGIRFEKKPELLFEMRGVSSVELLDSSTGDHLEAESEMSKDHLEKLFDISLTD